MGLRARCVLVLLFIIGLATAAGADTGGSMGGGSWGGGGGGDSSSSSYSYSSDSSSSYSRGSGSGADLPPELVIPLIIIGIIVWGVMAAAKSQAQPHLSLADAVEPTVDVSVLRIALDGRARAFVQAELARIAKVADTKTPAGRVAMLREVTLLLRRVRDAWVYGGAVNEPMRGTDGARATFEGHVLEARARFRTETVRNHQGQVTTAAAPASTPRSEEGAGVILVTLVVAAYGELFTVRHIADGEDLRKALEAASYRTERSLVALEVVWQPSDDADRLSSMELEAKYPAPALIPLTGALVGKMFCTYCGGPFPAELVSCPHCGAPARERAA